MYNVIIFLKYTKNKMKKFRVFIVWLCSLLIVGNISQAKDYEYTNLDINANILEDGTIDVTETYTANFLVNKHGIIRTIPLSYPVEWSDFLIEISNINVKWKNFKKSTNNWEIEIKIWDANHTVIWNQNYPISYSTYWLIRNFSWMGYAELYWNLVGYDFDTNINKVHAEIILPKIYTWFKADDFLITTDWSTTGVDEFWWTIDWSSWNKIIITYNKWLPAYQWITLSIKFPNNYFKFDHKRQEKLINKNRNKIFWNTNFFENISSKYNLTLISFIVIFVWVIFLSIKSKKFSLKNDKQKSVKELKKEYPVIVQYEPPNWLHSVEAWLLLTLKSTAKNMLSIIYNWAAEWLISISTETEKLLFIKNEIVILTKIKEIPSDAPDYEKRFFNSLISWETNKLEPATNLYSKLPLSELMKHVKKMWRLYDKKVPNGWWCIILISVILSFILMSMSETTLISWMILFFVSIIIWAFIWSNRLRESEEWFKLKSHILWYKEFLHTCDENKLWLFLQQDPLYFDKILPYAIVFWLETELLKKIGPIFEEMNMESSVYWNMNSIRTINHIISSSAKHSVPPQSSTSYSSSSWFSRGSSFWWWFSHGWGGWWGGGRSR